MKKGLLRSWNRWSRRATEAVPAMEQVIKLLDAAQLPCSGPLFGVLAEITTMLKVRAYIPLKSVPLTPSQNIRENEGLLAELLETISVYAERRRSITDTLSKYDEELSEEGPVRQALVVFERYVTA